MSSHHQTNSPDPHFQPAIRRARYDKLTIFEISESELEVLERGSPDSIFFNIAIALLSSSVALTFSLLTANVSNIFIYILYVVFIVVGCVTATILFILWYRSRNSVSDCIKVIRARLPPEGTLQPFGTESD